MTCLLDYFFTIFCFKIIGLKIGKKNNFKIVLKIEKK